MLEQERLQKLLTAYDVIEDIDDDVDDEIVMVCLHDTLFRVFAVRWQVIVPCWYLQCVEFHHTA